MEWFPDSLVHPLIVLKGSLSLLAMLTLALHLWRRRQAHSFRTVGQTLRYASLFGATLVLGEASIEQVMIKDFPFGVRNLLGLALSMLLLVTVWVSLREGGNPDDSSTS